ncbi:MAG TPA: 2-oxo-4-hydroxy-4-carboxy-5-ureidoimidazoline decarboxylase [Nocardioidaceae bacterium]|jgi:2-oxo-4-hydroxy-4-carboxy-5-ureidoimidazoline decarboxylase
MQLREFNGLAADEAQRTVDPCLGVRRWVDEVVAGRPYADLAALVVQAKASAENLSDGELAEALARHPRIGERADPDVAGGQEADHSRREQSGVSDHPELADRLQKGNRRYEDRFGRVFLVRAAGRSGTQILDELERRLDNDDETERRETVCALREIAVLRLQQVVQP